MPKSATPSSSAFLLDESASNRQKIEVEDRTAELGAPAAASATSASQSRAKTELSAAAKEAEQVRVAKMKGYEGDACGSCGSFTLVRNGSCLKCMSCGGTSGCS